MSKKVYQCCTVVLGEVFKMIKNNRFAYLVIAHKAEFTLKTC